MNNALTAHDVRRLSAEAVVHPDTLRRAYAGMPIRSTSRVRINAAAKKLRLPPPPTSGLPGGDDGNTVK